jgi:hypothetical protein
MSRAATDNDGDLSRRRHADANYSTVDPPNKAPMCCHETNG